jgi:transmembrane 9 superfamily protein 3
MELVHSGLDIQFRVDVQNATVCKNHLLNTRQVNLFRYAVAYNYWFSMFLDDLPIGGYVGDVDRVTGDYYLYTHHHYDISFNGNQIVGVNLTTGTPVKLSLPPDSKELRLEFTYSVRWAQSTLPFANRFDRYLDSEFFEHKIHFFAIFNSFMMVIFLTAFVGVILMRTLRHDLARYDKEMELGDIDRDLGDDYGWKLVHGDVFRTPGQLSTLSAMVGSGAQLGLLSLLVISYTMVQNLYTERASILTASIFLYALTSVVAGYYGGSLYSQYGGRRWIRAIFITAGLWPGVVAMGAAAINFVSISYSTTKAIPFGTIVRDIFII